MRLFLLLILMGLLSLTATAAGDDYSRRQADNYRREAEYYQKQADGYRKQAEYHLKQSESNQREAAYYTRNRNASRAKDYLDRAKSDLDRYETQMRYARQADEKAADYLKRASRALESSK